MLFLSLFAYAAAKNASLMGKDFREVDAGWRKDPKACPWVGWRTLFSEAPLLNEQASALVDGSTLITKARSRAAGLFLASGADVWLTCDDDVFAEVNVLERLIARARASHGIIAAPCAVRDGTRINVGLPEVDAKRGGLNVANGIVVASHVGFGLVALHRDAVLRASTRAPLVKGPPPFPALFLEHVSAEGEWIGEDWAFSRLCASAGVPLHVLLDAPTMHAGRRAQLTSNLEVLVDPETAATIGP